LDWGEDAYLHCASISILPANVQAHALYTDPPLGRIGLAEAEVRKSETPALIGSRPMTKVGRAVEKGETMGFIKVPGSGNTGTGGDEAIHCILNVMYSGSPYTTLQRAMHIHPTLSELIPTMLGDLHPLI
jgi:pyruvate/2-oxoglutarate dehydrogenase complex dihydrolipoamide dehydrogenase (E3) component